MEEQAYTLTLNYSDIHVCLKESYICCSFPPIGHHQAHRVVIMDLERSCIEVPAYAVLSYTPGEEMPVAESRSEAAKSMKEVFA